MQHKEAGQQDQPTDQWLPDNDTGVWTADAGKIPCEEPQGIILLKVSNWFTGEVTRTEALIVSAFSQAK